MNKKVYQEPAMRVVQTQHQGMLMTSDPEPFGSKASINNWGAGWRTPTDAEWTWLRENCTWIWKTTDDGYAHNGMIVTSNVNGNQIFLPAAGYRSGIYVEGSDGYYWSSSLDDNSSYHARCVFFDSGVVERFNNNRCRGQSIRPVME